MSQLSIQTAFASLDGFEGAQRMAKALVSSDLVPESFRGADKIGNALIALELSQRIGASPIAVMQNLHIIHGRPSWSSSFIIAALNACGRFSPIRFRVEGEGEERTCVAWTYDQATKEVLEGPQVSIAMAKAEGWATKAGSKWKTMPDLMLRYRAAAFFGRLYAPDVLSGMSTADEAQDIVEEVKMSKVKEINARIKSVEPAALPAPEKAEEQKQDSTDEDWS
jgi:hypothetical protein